jgi:hypothetical protein
VVLLLTESVRADVALLRRSKRRAHAPRRTPPSRPLPLSSCAPTRRRPRSSSPCCGPGSAGRSTREALHSAPLLFDYAHAAGMDTAYWTSHHMMFANSRLWVQDLPTSLPVRRDRPRPHADIDLGGDDALPDRAREGRDRRAAREPFFAVVHSATRTSPTWSTRPTRRSSPPSDTRTEDNEAYRNYYKNAVHLQDKAIGEMLRHLKSAPFADRTVIVHLRPRRGLPRARPARPHGARPRRGDPRPRLGGRAAGGPVRQRERSPGEEQGPAALFHTDFTPDDARSDGPLGRPSISSNIAKRWSVTASMRPFGEERKTMTLGLTNCSGVWGCAYKNWGVMRGSLKVDGREWYAGWRCFDVRRPEGAERSRARGLRGSREDRRART